MDAPATDRRAVYRTEPDLHLVGARCAACDTCAFPAQDRCPRCGDGRMSEESLPARGTLWTWTIQAFAPAAPPYAGAVEPFEPFGVGYVLLGDVLVEGRLLERDADRISIGAEMELIEVRLSAGEPEERTFAFQRAVCEASTDV